MSSTISVHLRGDIRAQFDEQRRLAGEPPTSIVNPAPAYVEPPEEIVGFDSGSDFSVRTTRTRWQNLNRPPVLRPRLKWMVYRVAAESPPLEAAQPTPALEPAGS